MIRNLWEIQEDIILLSEYLIHSSKWTKISQKLKGRTIYCVKNRFHSLLNKNGIFCENLKNVKKSTDKSNFFEKIQELRDKLFESTKKNNLNESIEQEFINNHDYGFELFHCK